MGLEQEFFLVDRKGAPSDLADPFLWGCQQAAREEGLDPRCFESESVKGLVEITTPPSQGVEEIGQALPGQSRAGVRRRVGARSRPVSVGDVPPPHKSRAPRRSELRGQGQHHRARSVLARGEMRRGASAPGAARRHGLARREVCARRLDRRAAGAPRHVQPRHRPGPGARGPHAPALSTKGGQAGSPPGRSTTGASSASKVSMRTCAR
jgi:hypothetical protein